MNKLNYLLSAFKNTFFSSADPHFFGANKRRKEKAKLANSYKEMAGETQKEIDALRIQNPFETAAAKSAMSEASRKAKQTQQRFANILGGNTNPEALLSAQQATQEAIAGTAGDIATGAEANKAAQLAQLRNEKQNQLGQSTALKMASIDEYGQGWKDFLGNLESATSSIGNITEGAGQAIGAIAAASDPRLKENIQLIGNLQGRNIYKYNFKGSPSVHIGVLANEIKSENPDMVINIDGIDHVFYNKVFKSV